MGYRIGIGYDVHALDKDLDLVLGGVKIPHYKGCIAHSDGDVLIHAICDALLGAAGLRDIGCYFPDNDQTYKGIDSRILLKNTLEIISAKGFKIVNIDSVISLQKPKLKDFIPQMIKNIAECLTMDVNDISVKATTTEHLGFEGREEGISARAVVLLEK